MIFIASDHAGFQLKKFLLQYLKTQLKTEAEDLGPFSFQQDDDFPDFATPLAEKTVKNKDNRGILICGSAHGMCIAANKIKGARAIVGYSIEGAEMGRRHNNANILCLAGRVISDEHAAAITKKFLETEFQNEERLVRRDAKITELEK